MTPSDVIANGCMMWPRSVHRPLKINSGLPCGTSAPRTEPIAHDLSVVLDVQRATMHGDAGATARLPVLMHRTETLDLIGFAVAIGVAQGHDVTARRVLQFGVRAAPGVHVDISAGCDGEMPRAPEIVGKHRCAKPWRQRETTVVLVAALALLGAGGSLRLALCEPLLAIQRRTVAGSSNTRSSVVSIASCLPPSIQLSGRRAGASITSAAILECAPLRRGVNEDRGTLAAPSDH